MYSDILFDTAIPWRSKVNEVATYGTNIMEYDGAADAASYYLNLADEVVERSRVATAA